MTLQVIGAGFGRTGTLSLKLALESLGVGPCHHWVELNRRPARVRQWLDAQDRNRRGAEVDWEALFEGYQATVDWPGCAHVCALKRAFPDARVVLTTRDPAVWYASVAETLLPLYRSMPPWLGVLFPAFGRLRTLATEVIWGENGTFNNRFADRDRTMAIFEAHQRKICDAVPAQDLLIFDIAQGYAPLCEFLGLPVPDTPFPRVNERATIRRNIRLLRLAQLLVPGALLALAAGLVYWLA